VSARAENRRKGILRTRLLKGLLIPAIVFLHACSTVEGPKTFPGGKKPVDAEAGTSHDGPPEDDLDVSHIPNATPQLEAVSRYGNPAHYEVFGQKYKTMQHSLGYEAEGTASWYGRKFHGKRTSCGEPYDMYAMTAAHKSLPLPTYARVTNVKNGKEVIVKINDRGPFVKDRLIDLSYAAAKKLGIHATGTGKVKIEAIDPVAWNKEQKTSLAMVTKAPKNSPKIVKPSVKKAQATALSKKTIEKSTQIAQKAKATAKPIQVAQNTKAKASVPKAAKGKATAKKASPAADKQLYIQLGSFSKKLNAQQLADRAGILTQALNNVDVHVFPNKVSNKEVYKVRVGPMKNKQQAQKLQKELLALENTSAAKLIYE
jgi:rare lipoprotein A